MSADVPPPQIEKPPTRSRVAKSNRRWVLLFAALTVILSAATVAGVRTWLRNSETLVFAVGDAKSLEARFAAKLITVLKNANSRLRVKIVFNPDNAKALAQFDRKEADLAVLRTDAKIPQRARALAVLEHDILLLISPAGKPIKSMAELRKKKIAVIADSESSVTFVRNVLEIADSPDAATRVQFVPLDSTLDKLLTPGNFGAVIGIAHASKIIRDRSFEKYAKHGGVMLNAIDSAKALARRNPGISEETLPAGVLSSVPAVPDDDLDTIGLQWLVVAQSRMPSSTAQELARAIYENKTQLALDNGFASKIEPADTDKDALIVAHHGAVEYINDDTKSFLDRYSDLVYLGALVLSVIGSIFAGIYTKVTRIAPEKASEMASAILEIGERVEQATTVDAVDALQDELEAILRNVVIGLHDETISSDGLDTFKLGYEFVRDEIGMRRDSLKRHAAHEDHATHEGNVVVVKTAQSA